MCKPLITTPALPICARHCVDVSFSLHLYHRWDSTSQQWKLVNKATTNTDGRLDTALIAAGNRLKQGGRYKLNFDTGAYFATMVRNF